MASVSEKLNRLLISVACVVSGYYTGQCILWNYTLCYRNTAIFITVVIMGVLIGGLESHLPALENAFVSRPNFHVSDGIRGNTLQNCCEDYLRCMCTFTSAKSKWELFHLGLTYGQGTPGFSVETFCLFLSVLCSTRPPNICLYYSVSWEQSFHHFRENYMNISPL